MMEPRQSTTVPNTSKTSALMGTDAAACNATGAARNSRLRIGSAYNNETMPNRLILSLVSCALAVAAERGDEIRLWQNGAPGSQNETAPEVFEKTDNPKLPKRFTVVHYPSIYVFLPPKET